MNREQIEMDLSRVEKKHTVYILKKIIESTKCNNIIDIAYFLYSNELISEEQFRYILEIEEEVDARIEFKTIENGIVKISVPEYQKILLFLQDMFRPG